MTKPLAPLMLQRHGGVAAIHTAQEHVGHLACLGLETGVIWCWALETLTFHHYYYPLTVILCEQFTILLLTIFNTILSQV